WSAQLFDTAAGADTIRPAIIASDCLRMDDAPGIFDVKFSMRPRKGPLKTPAGHSRCCTHCGRIHRLHSAASRAIRALHLALQELLRASDCVAQAQARGPGSRNVREPR